jgi:hypothetical protein
MTVLIVTLASVGSACHVSAQQLAKARVSGRVVSARDQHPLAHVKVALERQQNGEPVATVNAGEDGSFVFEDVPAGKFRLVGFAPGFVSSAYQEHEGYSTLIVTGAGVATEGLQLELTPGASIAGRLTDETGEPLANGNLMLYRETDFGAERVRRMRGQRTNDSGEYEFEDLPPGRYFLSAIAQPWYAVHPHVEPSTNVPYRAAIDPSLDVTYPQLFYPSSLDSNSAVPIALKAGEQFTADMQLQPVHALTITIRASAGERNGQRATYFPRLSHMVFGVEEPVPPVVETDSRGNQIIGGIAPGTYRVQEVQTSGVISRGLSTAVQLTSESISIDHSSPSPSSLVQIAMHTIDRKPLPAGLQLQLTTANRPAASAKADAQGSVTLKNVPEGDYQVRVSATTRAFPVVQLKTGGKEVPNKRLHVSESGEAVTVDLILASGAVNVEGVAQRDGKPAGGSMLALIPAGDDTSEELYRRYQSDLDGGFVFRSVIPGNYLLVAIDDGWGLRVTDAAAMQRYLLHAVPVSVPPTASGPMQLSTPVVTQPR